MTLYVVPPAGDSPREHPAQREARRRPAAHREGGAVTPPGMSQNEIRDNAPALFPASFARPPDASGAFMCDRLTAVVPVFVDAGCVVELGFCYWIDGRGEVEKYANRREMVEGSWSSKVSVQVHDCAPFREDLLRLAVSQGRSLVWLRIDGNPAKWFQPFNVWGSPDVWELAERFFREVVAKVGITGDVLMMHGYFNRVDATLNVDLGSFGDCEALVRQLVRFATISHRRSSGFQSSMLFPGRASSLSIYHKGPEMRAHPPKLFVAGVLECADRIVRFEVVSRSERLDAMGLRRISVWRTGGSAKLWRLWRGFVDRLRFQVVDRMDVSALKPAARRLYSVWLGGEDVLAYASRATAYRHRCTILAGGGPDIFMPRPEGEIIAFRRELVMAVPTVPEELRPFLFKSCG